MPARDERGESEEENPIGTLVLVLIYGALFGIGWLALYFLVYTPRGITH